MAPSTRATRTPSAKKQSVGKRKSTVRRKPYSKSGKSCKDFSPPSLRLIELALRKNPGQQNITTLPGRKRTSLAGIEVDETAHWKLARDGDAMVAKGQEGDKFIKDKIVFYLVSNPEVLYASLTKLKEAVKECLSSFSFCWDSRMEKDFDWDAAIAKARAKITKEPSTPVHQQPQVPPATAPNPVLEKLLEAQHATQRELTTVVKKHDHTFEKFATTQQQQAATQQQLASAVQENRVHADRQAQDNRAHADRQHEQMMGIVGQQGQVIGQVVSTQQEQGRTLERHTQDIASLQRARDGQAFALRDQAKTIKENRHRADWNHGVLMGATGSALRLRDEANDRLAALEAAQPFQPRSNLGLQPAEDANDDDEEPSNNSFYDAVAVKVSDSPARPQAPTPAVVSTAKASASKKRARSSFLSAIFGGGQTQEDDE